MAGWDTVALCTGWSGVDAAAWRAVLANMGAADGDLPVLIAAVSEVLNGLVAFAKVLLAGWLQIVALSGLIGNTGLVSHSSKASAGGRTPPSPA